MVIVTQVLKKKKIEWYYDGIIIIKYTVAHVRLRENKLFKIEKVICSL